jgi:hypothetical protein
MDKKKNSFAVCQGENARQRIFALRFGRCTTKTRSAWQRAGCTSKTFFPVVHVALAPLLQPSSGDSSARRRRTSGSVCSTCHHRPPRTATGAVVSEWSASPASRSGSARVASRFVGLGNSLVRRCCTTCLGYRSGLAWMHSVAALSAGLERLARPADWRVGQERA